MVPPIQLIPRVIKHVYGSQSRAVLVVPVWPSAVFWPFLIKEDGSFHSFVVDVVYTQNGKDACSKSYNKESLFGSDNFNSPVAFMLLNGALSAV